MAGPLPLHPFGIGYYLLLIGASLLRLPAYISGWLMSAKKLQALGSEVSKTRIQIPSREKGRTISVDLYEKADQPKDKKRYAHINFHGSGFVIPSLGSDIDFCVQLALTGTVVFDTDYRKAPEHPFPAAYQDAQDVLTYIQNHSSDFDDAHVTIGGFSAGANIAMTVAVNSTPGSIAGVVSIYGNTDMTRNYPAPDDKSFDSGIVLPGWLRTFFYNCLILAGQDRADTRLSPALAPLERWPKHVLFACGTADSLHEPEKVMANRLREAGHSDAKFLSVEREAHAFDKNVKEGSATEKRRSEVYQQAFDMIRRAHKSS